MQLCLYYYYLIAGGSWLLNPGEFVDGASFLMGWCCSIGLYGRGDRRTEDGLWFSFYVDDFRVVVSVLGGVWCLLDVEGFIA